MADTTMYRPHRVPEGLYVYIFEGRERTPVCDEETGMPTRFLVTGERGSRKNPCIVLEGQTREGLGFERRIHWTSYTSIHCLKADPTLDAAFNAWHKSKVQQDLVGVVNMWLETQRLKTSQGSPQP